MLLFFFIISSQHIPRWNHGCSPRSMGWKRPRIHRGFISLLLPALGWCPVPAGPAPGLQPWGTWGCCKAKQAAAVLRALLCVLACRWQAGCPHDALLASSLLFFSLSPWRACFSGMCLLAKWPTFEIEHCRFWSWSSLNSAHPSRCAVSFWLASTSFSFSLCFWCDVPLTRDALCSNTHHGTDLLWCEAQRTGAYPCFMLMHEIKYFLPCWWNRPLDYNPL